MTPKDTPKNKYDDIDYNILSQIFEKSKQMDVVQNAMFSKLNELVECNKVEKEEEDKEKQKKKLDEIFEKRKLGRPAGSLVEKQQQYFDLVCSGKNQKSSEENFRLLPVS